MDNIHAWQILDDVLLLLAKCHQPTPERTYKLDGGWPLALSDLTRYVNTLRAQLAASEADCLKAITERDELARTVDRLRAKIKAEGVTEEIKRER